MRTFPERFTPFGSLRDYRSSRQIIADKTKYGTVIVARESGIELREPTVYLLLGLGLLVNALEF